jgi:peptidoglycan/LPS O-acetylase OafA/YrhL
VLIGHWISWDTENLFFQNAPWSHGVILFFVISGYLITGILLSQKEKLETKKITFFDALKTFYFRRFFRIFPIYYLVIFFLLYIDYPKTKELFYWLVTYTINIYQGITNESVGGFNHFWSLAVEEQFYIIWPVLILLVPKKHLFKLFLFTIAFSFLSRLGCILIDRENWRLAAYFTPNLFLPLTLGAILAFIKKENVVVFYKYFKPAYALIALAIYCIVFYYLGVVHQNNVFKNLIDEYMFACVCALFVAVATIDGFSGFSKFLFENKLAVYTGRISYGIYIYHLFMLSFFWQIFTNYTQIHTESIVTARVFYFIIIYAIATLSFYIIEKPINSLKNKFKY